MEDLSVEMEDLNNERGNESGENEEPICKRIRSNLKPFLSNLVRLLISLWTVMDVILDIQTTHRYYILSQGPSLNTSEDMFNLNNTNIFEVHLSYI